MQFVAEDSALRTQRQRRPPFQSRRRRFVAKSKTRIDLLLSKVARRALPLLFSILSFVECAGRKGGKKPDVRDNLLRCSLRLRFLVCAVGAQRFISKASKRNDRKFWHPPEDLVFFTCAPGHQRCSRCCFYQIHAQLM